MLHGVEIGGDKLALQVPRPKSDHNFWGVLACNVYDNGQCQFDTKEALEAKILEGFGIII